LYLGNGDGTFQSPRQLSVSPLGPVAILAGDFNGDGKLDLAVLTTYLHNHVGRVSVLLGDGKGDFGHPIVFPLHDLYYSTDPVAMTLGDFNHDNKFDLALAYANYERGGAASVLILLGNGDGTLHKGVRARTGKFNGSIQTADFNGDGIPDLVVNGIDCPINGGHFACISVLLGNGDGTFRPSANFREGSGATQLTVADFNGDGKPDVAGVNVLTQNVSVLLNTTQSPVPKAKLARSRQHESAKASHTADPVN
jgi:FG-GAP-like repeat